MQLAKFSQVKSETSWGFVLSTLIFKMSTLYCKNVQRYNLKN